MLDSTNDGNNNECTSYPTNSTSIKKKVSACLPDRDQRAVLFSSFVVNTSDTVEAGHYAGSGHVLLPYGLVPRHPRSLIKLMGDDVMWYRTRLIMASLSLILTLSQDVRDLIKVLTVFQVGTT